MNILVTGGKGMLGSILVEKLKQQGHQVTGIDLPEYDITKPESLGNLARRKYDFIYNCAAFTAVDRCETEYEPAYAVNALGVKNLLAITGTATFLQISTDYVFNGQGQTPYEVSASLAPLSAYGKTKAVAEQFILDSGLKKYFIVRTAWLYGPNGKNFVDTIINLAKTKPELKVVNDQRGSPTYTEDFAAALTSFLTCPQHGIYHFTNSGETTWYNFAKTILAHIGSKTPLWPCTTAEYPTPAKRPAYSVLSLKKIVQVLDLKIPTWQDALQRYLATKGY